MATIKPFLAPAIILEALNEGRRWAKERQANATWWATKAHHLRPMPPGPEVYQEAGRRLRELLRSYVDEWISTGIEADGAECTADRDLSQAPQAALVVGRYTDENPPIVAISDGGPTALGVLFGSRRLEHLEGGHPIRDAEAEAARLFTLLQASDWRHTVAKCKVCDGYYQISNPERRYQYGTQHPKCARKASALRITRERRKWADDELLAAAAKFVRAYHGKPPRWQQTHPIAVWLAKQLTAFLASRLLQTRDEVKRNFVTLHWREIEARVQAGERKVPAS